MRLGEWAKRKMEGSSSIRKKEKKKNKIVKKDSEEWCVILSNLCLGDYLAPAIASRRSVVPGFCRTIFTYPSAFDSMKQLFSFTSLPRRHRRGSPCFSIPPFTRKVFTYSMPPTPSPRGTNAFFKQRPNLHLQRYTEVSSRVPPVCVPSLSNRFTKYQRLFFEILYSSPPRHV